MKVTIENMSKTIPDKYWYNIASALEVHGFCYCNLRGWPKGLTPQEIATLAEVMIFEPTMKIEATDVNSENGNFTLVRK